MDNIITWIKLVAGVITGLLSYLFGGLDMLFTALLVCMAVMAARELARDKEGAVTNQM